MRLAALVLVGFFVLLSSKAIAEDVDWSEYIDKGSTSKLPASKTPKSFIDMETPATAAPTRANKAPKTKRVARATKANKGAKPQSRAKPNRRR